MRCTNGERLYNSDRRASGRMARHPPSATGVCIVEERCPETGWSEGTYFSKIGLTFHKTRVDRKGIRHAHCRGQVRIRGAHAQSRLLQESGGAGVEWNNKDPFFDRDLNNFRLLFELRAIDAGVIITRCTELQRIFNQLGRGPSFGNSTTHMAKLLPRLDGGSGGGCPVVVFGIRGACYVED